MRRQEVKRFDESRRFQNIRKKRKSKYDVPNYYEGSTKPPFFVSNPGQSKFYDQKEKKGTLTDDPTLNLRPVKDRTVFSDEQQIILERGYQKDKTPDLKARQFLANLTELSEERVRIWFQNRKAKEKRDQEDELANFAEKIQAGETIPGYSVKPHKPASSIFQKLNQLDKIFERPSKPTNNNGRIYTPAKKKSHKERDIVKNLIRESTNRNSSTSTITRKTTTTKESQYFTTLTTQDEKTASNKIPTFQTFSRQLERHVSDQYRPASSTPSRKRYFRDEDDIDEAQCIQKMLKHTPVNTSVGDQLLDKKIKVEEESDLRFQINESRTSGPAFPQPSQTAVLPHQELNSSRPPALPAFQHPRERYIQQPSNSHQTLPTSFQPHQNEPPTINRTPMPAFLQPKQEPEETQFDFQQSHQTIQHPRHQIQSQQPTLQQTLNVINDEVNETVNSSQWSDPLAYLPRGMEDFKGFFTPDQLNILQLLHQRQVLDKLEQRVKNSTTDYLPPDTIEEVIDSGVGFVPTSETTEPTTSYSTYGQPGSAKM